MFRTIHGRSVLLGASVLAALGFGVTQALAAPETPTTSAVCVAAVCSAGCLAKGYEGGGVCQSGTCYCHHLDR